MRLPLAVLLALGLAPTSALAGELRGEVRLAGTVPVHGDLPVTKDERACGTAVPDESLEVLNGALANVVVTVVGAPPQPATHLTLDQRRCRFVPHVQVAPKGSTLELVNSDAVLHNVHGWMGIRTRFDVAMPEPSSRVPVLLDRPGTVELRCDVHGWMSAYVAVVEGPAAVSSSDGSFAIEGIPPGTYRVLAWHERLGEKSAEVTIPAEGTARVRFVFGE
jgi:plastocyanin